MDYKQRILDELNKIKSSKISLLLYKVSELKWAHKLNNNKNNYKYKEKSCPVYMNNNSIKNINLDTNKKKPSVLSVKSIMIKLLISSEKFKGILILI